MIIIITKSEDNYRSNAFNRFLEKIPFPFKLAFTKEDLDTAYHKVLGALSILEEDDYDSSIGTD